MEEVIISRGNVVGQPVSLGERRDGSRVQVVNHGLVAGLKAVKEGLGASEEVPGRRAVEKLRETRLVVLGVLAAVLGELVEVMGGKRAVSVKGIKKGVVGFGEDDGLIDGLGAVKASPAIEGVHVERGTSSGQARNRSA